MKYLAALGLSALISLVADTASVAGLPPVWKADSVRISQDMRSKAYIAPATVLWKSSPETSVITGEEALLSPGDGQAVLGAAGVCRMVSREGRMASLLLDFGRELQGGVRIVTGQYPSGRPV